MGGLASRFASSSTCSSAQTRFRRATCAVLRAGGPTPKHVAIVMDGNRRFAESRSIHRARGHEHGADKLVEVLEWCLALGVEALSVYAFSTDNLKRDDEEVAGLFALAERRLLELAASETIAEKKVRVRVLGDLFRPENAIPESLRSAAARVTTGTWHHEGPVLNVCFAYTGREDIAQAVGALGAAKRAGDIVSDDVAEDALERCLRGAAFDAARAFSKTENAETSDGEVDQTSGSVDRERGFEPRVVSPDRVVRRTVLDDVARLARVAWDSDDDCADEDEPFFARARASGSVPAESFARGYPRAPRVPPVDLLIRTSGETRLSDFILWGVSKRAVLCFLEVLWPDFSFTDMCHAVWTYQVSAAHARRCGRRVRRGATSRWGGLEIRTEPRPDSGRAAASPRRAIRRGGKEAPGGEAGTATEPFPAASFSLKKKPAVKAGTTARDDSREDVSVAWVDVGKEVGAETGAAFEFVAERNRKIVEETARCAAAAAT